MSIEKQHLTIFETTSLKEIQKQQLLNLVKDESKIAQIEKLLKKKHTEEAIVELRKTIFLNDEKFLKKG